MNFTAIMQWMWGAQIVACYYFRAVPEMTMGIIICAVCTIIRVKTEKEPRE
jgi:hypothetical protein